MARSTWIHRLWPHLLLLLHALSASAQQPTSLVPYTIGIVGTPSTITQMTPIINLAVNQMAPTLAAQGASLSTVVVPVPAEPIFPLQQQRVIDITLESVSQNMIGVLNLVDSGVAQAALENSSLPRVDVLSVQGFDYTYDIHMRIGARYYADALESLCLRFGWKNISVVVSDDAEESFFLLRQELFRRSTITSSPIRIAMIREFTSDASILANHEETYNMNVSILVVISRSRNLARLIDVSIRNIDDRAQYVWLCPVVGAEAEVADFTNEIARLKPKNYHGVIAIMESSVNPLVPQILANISSNIGHSPSQVERLAYDSVFTIADAAARLLAVGGSPKNTTAFFNIIDEANFVASLGFFEFNDHVRTGDLTVLNFVIPNNASTSSIDVLDFAGWSLTKGLHQELDQTFATVIFNDGTTVVPTDGFAQIVEFGIAAPVSLLPNFRQWEMALRLAKEHAAVDNIVGRFGLHIHIDDTGFDESIALEEALRIVAEENILVMMGEVLSRVTEPLHYVLRSSKVSQASPVSTTMALSDRKEFPYYWRTVPADVTLYTALVQTLKSQFNWNNVAVISSGEEEVDLSASVFTEACSSGGMGVVTAKGLQNLNATSVETALSQIKDTGARVIFAALSVDAVRPIFEAARKLDMTSPTSGFIWVLNFIPHILDETDPAVAALIPEGSISVAPSSGVGSVYQKYLNGTRQKTADARLNPMLSTSYIYDTSLLVMRAVKAIDGRGQNYYDRNLFYSELNKIDFVGATGRVALLNGDRLYSEVSIVRRTSSTWDEFVHHSFGGANLRDLVSSVSVKPYKFADPNTSVLKDLSLNYMKWQDGAGLAIVLITSLLLLCIVGSAVLVFFWRNNVMVRASSPAFLQVLLIGVTLAILSVFPSTGELNDASCTVRTWLFVFGFVMSYGACLLKNWRVYRLWSDASMRIIRISNLHLVGYSSVFMIPFTLLLIVWTVLDKPAAVVRGANLICEPGKSIVWSLLEFIGIGLMLVAGVVLAFMTRAIPQLYNECKHIALASYNLTFCLVIGVALSFILQPVSITAAYVCYTIGVLFAFGGLWAIVLGPKLYLIIFRPDKVAELSSGHSSSRSAKASTSSRTSATASTPSSGRSSSPKESSARMQGRGGSAGRSTSTSSSTTKPQSYVSTKSSTKEEESSSSESSDSTSSE
eukprot:TRINITY_DN7279_c0_g1_i1.p1 TRINITY_DN7279_c0_g1~~TRINITY_DN7279_c0_g1_i1.p1  ORF type:complete len:1170 (-),score=253.83 TRINITY_DN7279_c0_g1_i1:46-3555(-)